MVHYLLEKWRWHDTLVITPIKLTNEFQMAKIIEVYAKTRHKERIFFKFEYL